MKKTPFNLILLGDPASGKGVQAARLIKKYHFYDLDMGHEVRKPSVRRRYNYAGTTAKGKLTPTNVAREIFHRVIRTTSPKKGIIFNGNPKMISEARLVSRWLKEYKHSDPLVIYIGIPLAETLRRTKKRKRDDDTEQALKNRRAYYKNQISQVVAFFKKRYVVRRVSGLGSRSQVARRINKIIDEY